MSRSRRSLFLAILAGCLAAMPVAGSARQPKPRILVVMSYHEEYYWCRELRRGIETMLRESCDLTFAYLDMKNSPEKGQGKARETYALLQELKPDGVIAADDYAQSAFVVPYLKDKVKTPVIFCGVNNLPEDYGYPASNVTGVLERYHVKESLALLKKLVPSVSNVCVIMRGNEPSTAGVINQMKSEASTYPLKVLRISEPLTVEDAVQTAESQSARCNAFFIENFEGLPDRRGVPHSHRDVVKAVVKAVPGKPTVCGSENTVESGCLVTVVDSGFEQGVSAGKQMLEALSGVPLERIPITRNYQGVKVVNVNAMKELGIDPSPALLRDVKLVKTAE